MQPHSTEKSVILLTGLIGAFTRVINLTEIWEDTQQKAMFFVFLLLVNQAVLKENFIFPKFFHT